jgi:alkylhydroperoxidase family enzyme
MTPIGWDSLSATTVRSLAPEAIGAYDVVLGGLSGASDPVLVELVRRRVAGLLGASPTELGPVAELPAAQVADLAAWPTSPAFSAAERSVLSFAEQFVLDVSAVTDADRAALGAALGAEVFGFVQALYVIDHGLRLLLVGRQLFGVEVFAPVTAPGALWPALEKMMTAVVVLDGLDPLTSEVVRLRGARAHGCRICTSRRMAPVVAAHGEAILEPIDDIEAARLGPAAKAALRFTDAMLWESAAMPSAVVDAVRAHFTPAGALELMLDVARNASNKIAVALGGDAAVVTEGVEYFDISATGDYAYGLAAPVQA